jgi:hypothetical protein
MWMDPTRSLNKFNSRTQRKTNHLLGWLWSSKVISYYGSPRPIPLIETAPKF